jgi:hypothetical protein
MTATMMLAFLLLNLGALTQSNSVTESPQTPRQEEISMFYSELSPLGEWIEFQSGVYAWRPANVGSDWRPYLHGRWVWSDFGWYWISDEPFGWATYHYGRWYDDEVYGWIWIPDLVWGPAWVEWRNNDEYVGWAPLPPYARFHVSIGIRFTRRWIAPYHYWCFVPFRHFAGVDAYRNYLPQSNVRRMISTTRSVGRYEIDQDRIVNRGVERNVIELQSGSRIARTEIAAIPERGVERSRKFGETERIEVYRPQRGEIVPNGDQIRTRKAESRPSLDFDRLDRQGNYIPNERSMRGDHGRIIEQQVPRASRLQKQTERIERQETKRERMIQQQRPHLPSPRLNQATPQRSERGTLPRRSSGKTRSRD